MTMQIPEYDEVTLTVDEVIPVGSIIKVILYDYNGPYYAKHVAPRVEINRAPQPQHA